MMTRTAAFRSAIAGFSPASGKSESRSKAVRSVDGNAMSMPKLALPSAISDWGLNRGYTDSSTHPRPRTSARSSMAL